MNAKYARGVSVFWTLFIGLGAAGGALAMLIDPSGERTTMAGLLPGLQKLPFADALFQNLTFSGVALLVVNGLTQLAAFAMLIKRAPRAAACVIGCGGVLMLWIVIQFIIFPLNALSTAYFIFGAMELITGLWLRKEAKRA